MKPDSELFENIKNNVSTELQTRELAADKLARFKNQVEQIDGQETKLETQISEHRELMADMIGDGKPKKAEAIREKVKEFRAELDDLAELKETLSKSAIPKAEAELKSRQDAVCGVVGRLLDQAKAKLEIQMSNAFDKALDLADEWDTAVAALLDELKAHSPQKGIMSGSPRLCLVNRSERLVRHFINHFSLRIDVELWKIQRERGLNPATEKQAEAQESQKTVDGQDDEQT